MSIGLGVLLGAALYRVVLHGADEIVQFGVAPTTAVAEAPRRLFDRLLPWRRARAQAWTLRT